MSNDPIHILVVDDDENIRELFGVIMEEQGYVCQTASGGEAALEVLGAGRVDIAVVDFMMPKMTGATLFQHIKERHPDVAVIFATAVDDLNIAVEQLKEGAYDYIVKPVSRTHLEKVVRQVIARRAATLKERGELELLDDGQGASTVPDWQVQAIGSEARRRSAQKIDYIQGTVNIMFTDLEGSTELLTLLGDEEHQALLAKHNEIIRLQLANHDGVEVKTMGDGFMAVFSSARTAIACAIDIQRGLQGFDWTDTDLNPKVRIGINVGETIKEEGDFFGSAVVQAERIMGHASGGKILVSDLFRQMAGPSTNWTFIDSGFRTLKGYTEEVRLYEVRWS